MDENETYMTMATMRDVDEDKSSYSDDGDDEDE